METLYTCEQVAERYSVPISTVWRWIRDKKLSAVKVGRCYRVKETALAEFEKETN